MLGTFRGGLSLVRQFHSAAGAARACAAGPVSFIEQVRDAYQYVLNCVRGSWFRGRSLLSVEASVHLRLSITRRVRVRRSLLSTPACTYFFQSADIHSPLPSPTGHSLTGS